MLNIIGENRNYYGFPQKAMAWHKAYIHLLDAASGFCESQTVPDGWLPEYTYAYMRLSAALFAVGEKDKGYECIEKALGFAKQYFDIPDGQPIDLGNSIFYGDTKAVRGDDYLILPNGKKLENFYGISYYPPCICEIMEAKSGWEWFNSVRNEERFLALLEEAKSITE